MKTFISFILLLVVFQGFSQKKKNKEDPRDLQIDSLTKANALLAVQVDSISKDQKVYYGLYTTIKDKVLLKDFDPAKFPQIVDSIKASRDSSNSLLSAPVAGLKDSLSIYTKENSVLKSKVDSMTVALNANTASNADKTKLMTELKDLKALLDAKIINQQEYDAKKKLIMDRWQ